MNKESYALGLLIGKQLTGLGASDIVVEDFCKAVTDVLTNAKPAISPASAQLIVNKFLQAKKTEMEKKIKEKGEKFLKENKQKEGVITLPSGLQYQVLKEGDGKKPKATDNVRCHYEGTLIDGTVFDSSYERNQPADFPLNGVIKGWTEGVQLMSEGAKYRFFIPYNLAYGPKGAGDTIPGYSTLIFDVELIKVL